MDLVIQQARELGKLIQEDYRYKNYMAATVANEKDTDLQQLIANFDISRTALNEEISQSDKDTESIKELDTEVKEQYSKIFASPTMVKFTESRNELQDMLGFVNQIITGSSNGQNPETIEQAADCGGSCGSCSGC